MSDLMQTYAIMLYRAAHGDAVTKSEAVDFLNAELKRLVERHEALVVIEGRAASAEQRLSEIAKLQPNWDSYGGDPPTPEAMEDARRLVRLFAIPAIIVPTSHGGVQIEWHAEGFDLEITIPDTDDEEISFYIEEQPVTTFSVLPHDSNKDSR